MNKKEYKQAAAADEAMMVGEPAVGYDATVVAKPCPQLLLTIEDESMIKDIRKALKMIKGVVKVGIQRPKATNKKYAALDEALADVREGRVSTYASLEDFIKEIVV